eukprot:6461432-Pyramimonas_sp.AAC.1
MSLEVTRGDQKYKEDAALAWPRVDEERDAAGNIIVEADISGAGHLMQRLTEAFEADDQDKQCDFLDRLLDTRRGNQTLQEYLLNFRERYTDANDKANLTISNVGLTHMLFTWSGLPTRCIADIKLHIDGDLD